MDFILFLVLLMSFNVYSSATYCLCKDGLGDQALQKAIDYACGTGADCTPILQNGACYQPNTVKDHCNYAVNSYYQRKGQATGSCDFAGAATVSANPPSTTASGCAYPLSAGNNGTTPSTSTTPTTGTTTPNSSVFGTGSSGLGPTGASITNPSGGVAKISVSHFLLYLSLTLWTCVLCLIWG